MMNVFKIALGALVVGGFFLGSATPAQAATCNSSQCTATIEQLYASPVDDQVYLDLEGATSGLSCAPAAGKYFVMALNTDTKRATWQLLVAAFLSGKTVTVRLNTVAGNQCNIQYVTVAP
jgi:hypothetical protein